MNAKAMDAIRGAFASGEFAKAQHLWTEYAGELRQAILDGSATQSMLSETGELVDWSRLVARAFRAQAVDRLNSVRLAQLYSHSIAGPRSLVRASF